VSFVDGNKRIALAITSIFLEIDDFSLDVPEPQSVITIEQLGAVGLSEIDLAQWLNDSSVPVA